MAVIAAAGVVVAIGGAIMGGMAQRAAAQAQLIVAKANAEAGNITRAADNEYRGAAAALTNFVRAQQNKRILDAAGEQYNAMSANIIRTMDDATSRSVTRQLQSSEALGTIAAQAAAAGVGGSSIDSINSTFQRVSDIADNAENRRDNIVLGDMSKQQNQIMENAGAQLDQNQTFANIDYSHDSAPYIPVPSMAMSLLNGLGSALPYVKQYFDNRAAQNMAATLNANAAGGAGGNASGNYFQVLSASGANNQI